MSPTGGVISSGWPAGWPSSVRKPVRASSIALLARSWPSRASARRVSSDSTSDLSTVPASKPVRAWSSAVLTGAHRGAGGVGQLRRRDQRVEGVDHRLGEGVAHRQPLELGRLDAELGRLAAEVVLAAAEDREGADDLRTNVLRRPGVVEVEVEAELALVEDHRERLRRIVGAGEDDAAVDARVEGGRRLAEAGLGLADALGRGAHVGVLAEGEADRILDAQRLRRRRRRRQRGEQRRDGQPSPAFSWGPGVRVRHRSAVGRGTSRPGRSR